MLAEGLLNKQIAYELGVSEATIKAHVSAILQKLGVDSRTQAVILLSKIGARSAAGLAHVSGKLSGFGQEMRKTRLCRPAYSAAACVTPRWVISARSAAGFTGLLMHRHVERFGAPRDLAGAVGRDQHRRQLRAEDRAQPADARGRFRRRDDSRRGPCRAACCGARPRCGKAGAVGRVQPQPSSRSRMPSRMRASLSMHSTRRPARAAPARAGRGRPRAPVRAAPPAGSPETRALAGLGRSPTSRRRDARNAVDDRQAEAKARRGLARLRRGGRIPEHRAQLVAAMPMPVSITWISAFAAPPARRPARGRGACI